MTGYNTYIEGVPCPYCGYKYTVSIVGEYPEQLNKTIHPDYYTLSSKMGEPYLFQCNGCDRVLYTRSQMTIRFTVGKAVKSDLPGYFIDADGFFQKIET